jgi:hypothetical protein
MDMAPLRRRYGHATVAGWARLAPLAQVAGMGATLVVDTVTGTVSEAELIEIKEKTFMTWSARIPTPPKSWRDAHPCAS